MAESGTYDYSTLQRRQKIAEEMLAQSSKPQQIDHWAQGLAQIANIGADTYRLNQLEKQAADVRKSDVAAMMGMLGGAPATPAASVPSAAAPEAAPAPAPAPTSGDRIAGIESGGRYDALGPVIPKSGDRAYGKYQVMGANIPEWTAKHAGRSMTPQEFLQDPDAQEAVFKGQFGGYERKYGPEGAARAWFAGEGGMNNPNARDPLGTSVADYSRKFMGGGAPRGAVVQAMAPNVVGPKGGAAPDADGIYPADAVMMPGPTDVSAQAKPPRAAVADAMAPATAAPAAPPAQTFGGIPANQKAAIARGLATTPGSPAHTLAMGLLTKAVSKEREEVRPMTPDERKKWQVPEGMSAGIDQTSGKPIFSPPQTNVAVNSVADPIREGIGKTFNANRDKALTAAREVIPSMHDARTALDQGIFSGAAGDVKLALQKIGGVFGMPTTEAANTETFRAAIGKQVLGHIKALGANPSNADREFISSIEGGKGTLEEATLRRLLDIGEKYARQSIRNHNADAEKIMKVQPDSYKGVAPIMMVDEPAEYAKPAAPPAPKAAPAAIPANPAVDDLVKKYGGQ